MSAPLSVDIQKAWNRFLQEVELAKNYHMPYLLNGFGGTFRNPLFDYLLPSLLYVKMVTILDEALLFVIGDRRLTVPKKYKNSLHGRIEYLNDQSLRSRTMPHFTASVISEICWRMKYPRQRLGTT